MHSTLNSRGARSRLRILSVLLPSLVLIASAQSPSLQYSRNADYQALLHRAYLKWTEAVPFERTGNWVPAALCLQNATRLAAQVPSAELANGDLLFIAQLQTAYANARFQTVGAQPGEQSWGAYLQAADDAKTAIDIAGRAVSTGQPAASVLMLRAQIDLMNCNYKTAIRTAQIAAELYSAEKATCSKFVASVENSQKNGSGPCESNLVSRSAQWKQYAQEISQAFELVQKLQTVAKYIE